MSLPDCMQGPSEPREGFCEMRDERDAYDRAMVAADKRANALALALRDMLAGWRYIREVHGDLYGVAWDRCECAAIDALTKNAA